jgi:hypothetical protein
VTAVVLAAAVAFLHGGNLVVLNTATHAQRVVLRHAGAGPVAWSGDGRLVSSGGAIAGGPRLPTAALAWSPTGETAAYITHRGAVYTWSPRAGRRLLLPASWGAQALAWSENGELALGRSVCRVPCGRSRDVGVWVRTARGLHRVARLPDGGGLPMPVRFDPRGRVLWWLWPNSGSIAADGVFLYANAKRIASTLMYGDYVAVCGRHLALAVGGDRNSMHGKSIVFDGRNVSRDPSRSWVSPSCNARGELVAAADPDNTDGPWGNEHRSLWQLLPVRKRLTSPPRGWSDESPTVLANGSIVFVRTHLTSHWAPGVYHSTDHGTLELYAHGRVTPLADVTTSPSSMYYGHYTWPLREAVEP